MNIEEKLEECKFNLQQIRNFEPDPYYVEYFFKLYLKNVSKVIDAIFEEESSEFGLFGVFNEEKFREQAMLKKDDKAIEFVSWFDRKFHDEHRASYANFLINTLECQKKGENIPKIKIMLRAKERYFGDMNQEIFPNTRRGGKLRTREELVIEIERNRRIFLETINHKRRLNDEPKIHEKQIMVSTFMQINEEYFEIIHACEVYLVLLNRILVETRKYVRDVTR